MEECLFGSSEDRASTLMKSDGGHGQCSSVDVTGLLGKVLKIDSTDDVSCLHSVCVLPCLLTGASCVL